MARLSLYVVPRSKHAGPDGYHGALPRLRVRAQPSEGKANAEAERVLTELFGATASLIAGAKSRLKHFDIAVEERALKRIVNAAFKRAPGPT